MSVAVSLATAILLLASLGKNYFVCLSGVAAISDELVRIAPLICAVLIGPLGIVLPRERRDKAALVVVVISAAAQSSFLLARV